ncbi:MAG: class I SAM-dependent methyltransferase [Desulfuromonadaceae bacterium]
MEDPKERFGFGQNWNDFIIKQFSPERVTAAKSKLLGALRLADLRGKTFLDIGCGSGLHSLAAIQAGAERVVSFDYDPNSVRTAQMLKEMFGNPGNWQISQGSVLDEQNMKNLGTFDIVYSWGVLHHTGFMWKAIENARIPLGENGVFLIALYSHTAYQDGELSGRPSPEQWVEIKKKYNSSHAVVKRFMEWEYVWHDSLKPPISKPWLVFERYAAFKKREKEYVKERGMEIWTDIRDWLGGYPMEFVNEFELQAFAKERLGLKLVEMLAGEGNTEFILCPFTATNWWAAIDAGRQCRQIKSPFTHVSDNCWMIELPDLADMADSNDSHRKSTLRMYEGTDMMSFAHSTHRAIHRYGAGRYSHWNGNLYFSTSDNSDPNTNGRIYSIRFNL